MSITFLPLAVDIVDIARAIVIFVFLAGGIARLFADANRAQKKAPPQPRQQPPGGAPPANPQQEAIRAEVDEFLRRAGAERPQAEAPPRQQPQRPPRIEVLDDGIQLETRPRRQQPPPRPLRTRPEKKKKSEQRAGMAPRGERPNFGGTTRGTLTPSVRPRLSERADELGADIKQADERFEARMQRNFDHRVGTLAAERATAEKLRVELSRTTLADDLMTMLSSPAGVRQALVLSEILNRPVDRWT